MNTKPRLLLVTGYYDDFSGYQEVVLARALSQRCQVTVVSGDRVSPIFTDETLSQLERQRYYALGTQWDGAVQIKRFPFRQIFSLLVPGLEFIRYLSECHADRVVILALGQAFSAPAAWLPANARRVVIFGDNRAQWTCVGWKASLRSWIFAQTKGRIYRSVIKRSRAAFGVTPNTVSRLAKFARGKNMMNLPLAADGTMFHPDEEDRQQVRIAHGWTSNQRVLSVVGKVQAEKCIEWVVRAASDWPDTVDWRLVVSGLGIDDYSTIIREQVACDENLRSRCSLFGYQTPEQLASLLRASDVCVWPKQPAITIQQAMVSGARIIVPNNDLTGHLVTSPTEGATFSESSFEGLSAAIVDQLSASDDGDTRRCRAANASYLTADAVAERLLSVLDQSGVHLEGT